MKRLHLIGIAFILALLLGFAMLTTAALAYTQEPPKCPYGWHWDEYQGRCVKTPPDNGY